jgi:transposase
MRALQGKKIPLLVFGIGRGDRLVDSLGQILAESRAQPIGAMWRFSKSNSITEGFHRKMKLIQRRAYGFRNFTNYRLRVIAQCG